MILNKRNRLYNAFTLAEVLITLAVIGVIASISIPSLMNNFQKQQTATRLKKMYSALTQAVKMSELKNGFISSWSFPTVNFDLTQSQTFYNTYIYPYTDFSIARKCTAAVAGCWASDATYLDGWGHPGSPEDYESWLLNDGTAVAFGNVSTYNAQVYVDINGPKKPNVMGRDIFYLLINRDFGVIPYSIDATREYLLENHHGTCNAESNPGAYKGVGCATVIMKDGWQIKEGYPW